MTLRLWPSENRGIRNFQISKDKCKRLYGSMEMSFHNTLFQIAAAK